MYDVAKTNAEKSKALALEMQAQGDAESLCIASCLFGLVGSVELPDGGSMLFQTTALMAERSQALIAAVKAQQWHERN
jgi:hypothetical protein